MAVNRSHHGASTVNSAKNNSVTPIFLYVIQFYLKNCAITESLKKFSGADFLKTESLKLKSRENMKANKLKLCLRGIYISAT